MAIRPKSFLVSVRFKLARSYRACNVEFSPGLNVVVGQSDSGKTNVYRNILAAVQNDTASLVRSFGAKDSDGPSEIELRFSGGESVVLRKGGSGNANDYVLRASTNQEELFRSVGFDVPQAVSRVINMGRVDFGGEIVFPNFASQRGPAILVDSSAASAARVLGSVSGLDVVFRSVAQADTRKRAAVKRERDAAAAFSAARDHYRKLRDSFRVQDAERLLSVAESAHAVRLEKARLAGFASDAVSKFSSALSLYRAASRLVKRSRPLLAAAELAIKKAEDRATARGAARLVLSKYSDCAAAVCAAERQVALSRERLSRAKTVYSEALSECRECPLCGSVLGNSTMVCYGER